MENEIIVKPNSQVALPSSIPSEHEMMVYQTMAEAAVSSKMYKSIGEKSGVMMIMLSARELGIPPMQALNGGINIIQGKVEISARMMSALIRRAGHRIKVQESDEKHCVLVGQRCDTGESQTASFSVQEAQLAGLVKPGGGWTKWPKDMCFARALSRLSRWLFSDVIGIGYVEGEINIQATAQPIHVEEIVQESFSENINTPQESHELFLGLFNPEDREAAIRYANAVKDHFKWTYDQTISELILDEARTLMKFQIWRTQNEK